MADWLRSSTITFLVVAVRSASAGHHLLLAYMVVVQNLLNMVQNKFDILRTTVLAMELRTSLGDWHAVRIMPVPKAIIQVNLSTQVRSITLTRGCPKLMGRSFLEQFPAPCTTTDEFHQMNYRKKRWRSEVICSLVRFCRPSNG